MRITPAGACPEVVNKFRGAGKIAVAAILTAARGGEGIREAYERKAALPFEGCGQRENGKERSLAQESFPVCFAWLSSKQPHC